MDEDKLLSISDVCRVLGIGKSTWYRWKAIGHGPPTVPIGPPSSVRKRIVRVRRSELMEFIGGNHE